MKNEIFKKMEIIAGDVISIFLSVIIIIMFFFSLGIYNNIVNLPRKIIPIFIEVVIIAYLKYSIKEMLHEEKKDIFSIIVNIYYFVCFLVILIDTIISK